MGEFLKQIEDLFPVTEAYVQKVLMQMFRALAHLHDTVGMFHRDIKPTNFRFRDHTADSALVLLDFDFAGSTSRPWDRHVCGTRMFMAPELVGSSAQVPHLAAMDLWAMGVIVYLLLTGDGPIQEEEVKLLGMPNGAQQEAEEVLKKAMATRELGLASAEVIDLLGSLLVLDPCVRVTAAQALQHPWFTLASSQRELNVDKAKLSRVRKLSRPTFVLENVELKDPVRDTHGGCSDESRLARARAHSFRGRGGWGARGTNDRFPLKSSEVNLSAPSFTLNTEQ